MFCSIWRSHSVQSIECKTRTSPFVCNFLCKYVFCLQRGGKGYWQTKHEVEKIWFWWRMSGQLEMCAFFSVLTILRSFLLFFWLHVLPGSALKPYFISLITLLRSRHMSCRTRCKQKSRAVQFCIIFDIGPMCVGAISASDVCRPQDWRAGRRSILSESAPNWAPRARLRDGGARCPVYGEMTIETNWSTSFWLYHRHKDKCSN